MIIYLEELNVGVVSNEYLNFFLMNNLMLLWSLLVWFLWLVLEYIDLIVNFDY